MALLDFIRRKSSTENLAGLLEGFSIEVMPRTAANIADFRELLPAKTRVYIANIQGTPIDDMIATARRLSADGMAVMPHIPARLIKDKAALDDLIQRYRYEADVKQALLLGGDVAASQDGFDNSMELMETGLFDKHGFKNLHVAGHPEGNRQIDTDGSTRLVDEALMWKQDFSSRTDAKLAIVTQFAFDANVVVDWTERLRMMGVTMPVHVGVAGPARLSTLIKFAMTCGVGPSLSVLKKRGRDLANLALPYEPTDVLSGIAAHLAQNPDSLIKQIHMFPLGGVQRSAEWVAKQQFG